ncbi:hypothetical protein F4810DRAFT_661335 [Camillea tinctor]|nr:hypothetical protein F4810DRAFT_661335 [Camillea tinctor]
MLSPPFSVLPLSAFLLPYQLFTFTFTLPTLTSYSLLNSLLLLLTLTVFIPLSNNLTELPSPFTLIFLLSYLVKR